MRKYEIFGLIPARGGSKGIPRKNMVMLAGKPLIQYTFESALESSMLTRIILSTDDEEIAEFGKKFVEVPFIRPKRLASDSTPMIQVVRHALGYLKSGEQYEPDYIAILQPTSPLRKSHHIDEAIKLLMRKKADSVVSVCVVPGQYNPFHVRKIVNGRLLPFLENAEEYTSRQKLPRVYTRNGVIYCFKRETLIKKNSLYGSYCCAYVMEREVSINIDSPTDLLLAEIILGKNKSNNDI